MENLGSIETNALIFLLGAAMLHGFYLAVILFFRNRHSFSNRMLGVTLAVFSLYLLNYLVFLTGIIRTWPHLLGVFFPGIYLAGPCFYFFIRTSLQPGFRWRPRCWIHGLPFLYALVMVVPVLLAGRARKLEIIEWYFNPGSEQSLAGILLGNDYLFLLLAYTFAAWLLAGKEKQSQENPGNRIKARWLQRFSAGLLVLLAADLTIKISFFALDIPAVTLEFILASLIAIAIHIAGYQAMGGLDHFPRIEWSNGKYKTSPLSTNQMAGYRQQLIALMASDKPFLEPNLKISDLAAKLNMPSHYLSQVLNEEMQTNFYDFINGYRVKEAGQRLLDKNYRHYSILAIGLDCGFTNKTTFNRTFKKITGLTPSEYQARGVGVGG